MIEIVKRGVPYEDRFFKIRCRRCLSTLKFRGNEPLHSADFDYVTCPVCETWLNVEDAWDMPLKPKGDQPP